MSTTMANISAAQVKDLREKNRSSMMDCSRPSPKQGVIWRQAVVILAKKGVSVAARSHARHQRRRGDQLHSHAGARSVCFSK